MISDQEKYLNLATQKRDGSFVNTPVWFAQAGLENIYFVFSLNNAGKVKRIRNFSGVKVAPCTFKGKLTASWQEASATLVDDEETINRARCHFRNKYGLTMRVSDFFSRLVGNYQRRQYIVINLE